ncbi:DUF4839 domain-containing protein [Streptomyces massasporeus]|uniref:DUF4839 domain-containing protein n=1 Tax=Streptomyces massasporeus TaxID=67324 RepID=UPI00371BEDE1
MGRHVAVAARGAARRAERASFHCGSPLFPLYLVRLWRGLPARYDYILRPGVKGPNTTAGPAFKYEDANVFDLRLTGRRSLPPSSAGDRFRFVAKVGEFNGDQYLFFLDPV